LIRREKLNSSPAATTILDATSWRRHRSISVRTSPGVAGSTTTTTSIDGYSVTEQSESRQR